MYSLLKSLSFIVLIFALAFAACDDGGKTTILPIGGGAGTQSTAGQKTTYKIDGVTFNMASVPSVLIFPTGVDDSGDLATISNAYLIGETEVAYELWDTVYDWAVLNGYTFANSGIQGGASVIGPILTSRHPVTTVNWRDAIVWCNALTEWYNAGNGTAEDLDCVYYTDSGYTTPLRVSTNDPVDDPLVSGQEDRPYIKAPTTGNVDMADCTARGFRLPTSMEWECAARYRDGIEWTPGDFASGATADFYDGVATSLVAVYNASSTAAVKSRKANMLGLYDMSGNVYEWCFDWYTSGSSRVIRGGHWGDTTGTPVGPTAGLPANLGASGVGFRIARTAD